jgi:Family of unknown function (DUF5678)
MPSEPSTPTIVVPIEYAGKWIAWDKEKTRIVASGATLEDAARAAKAAGETEPSFAKAPRADIRFCGVHR